MITRSAYWNLMTHPAYCISTVIRPIWNRAAIGIVGSRNATPQGIENALAFSRVLADAGFTIISGLALGIDAAAHEGAIRSEAASGTIAIIGTGIDRVVLQ